ncbi:MAG TPA: OsmC family protein [Candidatus Dormibacteraeota bacterium]|nr:OsmC family protein [Candidatus Dormibacteraeota bacterium]
MATGEAVGSLMVVLDHRQGYEFNAHVEGTEIPDLITDEGPPLGGDAGPNPAALLTTAIANCLSSSLLFCLKKARVPVEGMRTRATAEKVRDERGRLRIGSVRVAIEVTMPPEHRERFERCRGLFEDYCTVTASVRQALPVEVTATAV